MSNITAALRRMARSIVSGFETLQRIQFAAPWNQPRGC
jgi:hypothetical protein